MEGHGSHHKRLLLGKCKDVWFCIDTTCISVGLASLVTAFTYTPSCRVNANLDLIISATVLLRALNITPGPPSDHAVLSNLAELQELVGYSMQHCAGIERFFSNQEVFQQTVQVAASLPHTVSGKIHCYCSCPYWQTISR